MSYIIDFIGTGILTISQVISWYNISSKKYDYTYKKNYYKLFTLIILIFLSHNFCPGYIKGLLTTLIGFVFCKIFIELPIRKSIIVAFIGQLIVIVSEAVLVGLCILLFDIKIDTFSSMYVSFVFDILMFIVILLISKLSLFKKMYNLLTRMTDYIKINQLIVFLMFVVLGSNIFGASLYYKNHFIVALLFNILISIIYTGIIIYVFKYQYKYNNIYSKYNMILDSLKLQENMINDYRIINHENKNQLMVIRGMINNKSTIEYIDSLIKQKKNHQNSILNLMIRIPEGGIRGLMYGKLCYMEENKIKYRLDIDNTINTKELSDINSNTMVDICHILGVFIDNAIDETIKYSNKYININFYKQSNQIVISITNYHENNSTLNSTNQNFKSTKGKNHGYGLQLVKNIISRNKELANIRQITKDTFTQKLIVKIK